MIMKTKVVLILHASRAFTLAIVLSEADLYVPLVSSHNKKKKKDGSLKNPLLSLSCGNGEMTGLWIALSHPAGASLHSLYRCTTTFPLSLSWSPLERGPQIPENSDQEWQDCLCWQLQGLVRRTYETTKDKTLAQCWWLEFSKRAESFVASKKTTNYLIVIHIPEEDMSQCCLVAFDGCYLESMQIKWHSY